MANHACVMNPPQTPSTTEFRELLAGECLCMLEGRRAPNSTRTEVPVLRILLDFTQSTPSFGCSFAFFIIISKPK